MPKLESIPPPGELETHPMPSSLESERAILGAILLDEKAFLIASERLQAEDFYLAVHCIIFGRMIP